MVLAVDRIVKHQYNTAKQQWELLISWKGLQTTQDSWEPLTRIAMDIPVMVAEYIDTNDVHQIRRALSA
ncbi:hypothetical protein P43SY_000243 [Pythium insidiosum]|uniref:Chromo domain-containing protein n=1 Tax=Pythium insidiosum TaxID=114742 RepID=A0AAD5M816_PYTIN|nr:hypothetical protein P43SY_000243 [Pythium insidiosum]